MERKNVKIFCQTKNKIELLKERLDMKAESDVIAYLLAYYTDTWHQITLKQDEEYRQQAEKERNELI